MEIGTWEGTRALKMIQLAQKYHHKDKIEYYGFDLFESLTQDKFREEISKWPPSLSEAKQKLEKTGASIHLFKGDTMQTLPNIIPSLPNMDFIFIDGGHSLKTIANDWEHTNKLMDKKTILIFDDYWLNRDDAGAKVTVDGISRKLYKVKILPITDYFKKTNFGPLKIKLARVEKR